MGAIARAFRNLRIFFLDRWEVAIDYTACVARLVALAKDIQGYLFDAFRILSLSDMDTTNYF